MLRFTGNVIVGLILRIVSSDSFVDFYLLIFCHEGNSIVLPEVPIHKRGNYLYFGYLTESKKKIFWNLTKRKRDKCINWFFYEFRNSLYTDIVYLLLLWGITFLSLGPKMENYLKIVCNY